MGSFVSYTRFKSMSFAKISSIVFQGYGYLSTAVVRCYSRNVLYIYIYTDNYQSHFLQQMYIFCSSRVLQYFYIVWLPGITAYFYYIGHSLQQLQ